MEIDTRSAYESESSKAAFSVLIELWGMLGEFRRQMAVVGGWVPPLILPEAPGLVTTLDVDLVLDFRRISDDTYSTLLRTLQSHGYVQDEGQPFRFFRTVTTGDGRAVDIEVDLLAGEYGGTGRGHRTQPVQDVRARKARGADLVFGHSVNITVTGRLPNGAIATVTMRVADAVAFLAMKGMALHDRRKAKDAYDVFSCVANYPGGIEALVSLIRPHLGQSLVREGLAKIRANFLSPEHFGPVSVAEFLEVSPADERAIITRDAYERIGALMTALGVEAWEDLGDEPSP